MIRQLLVWFLMLLPNALHAEIIEVQRGPLLREDDIERFADDYGRV